jgi:hypothetical protein
MPIFQRVAFSTVLCHLRSSKENNILKIILNPPEIHGEPFVNCIKKEN